MAHHSAEAARDTGQQKGRDQEPPHGSHGRVGTSCVNGGLRGPGRMRRSRTGHRPLGRQGSWRWDGGVDGGRAGRQPPRG